MEPMQHLMEHMPYTHIYNK